MADSIDRVFVHALNTVKRIPRLGSARPPPAERLKLYGLYKQSMEGDVDGVMDRPRSDNGSADGADARPSDELRADQQKWDAWYAQRGLSRTDAKRRYITTLVDTMRVYASQTADARELVTELEFVWDQIKSNPPSSSEKSPSSGRSHSGSNPNSTAYSSQNPQGESPESTSDPPIYPLMSERGSRNPRAGRKRGREAVELQGTDDRGLRVLSPISQGHGDEDVEADEEDNDDHDEDEGHSRHGEEDDTEELEGEDFVDAPDSQVADGDRGSQRYSSSSDDEHDPGSPSPASPARRRQPLVAEQRNAASAIIEPIAKYIQKQRGQRPAGGTAESTAKWERRIESALVKMNTEMVALREQLDMQQHNGGGSVYSSIVYPFSSSRRPSYAGGPPGRGRQGIMAWLLESAMSLAGILVRHLVVDALVIALITLWMHYRGIPPERLEELISGWIRRVRALAFFKRLERIRKGETRLAIPLALRRAASNT